MNGATRILSRRALAVLAALLSAGAGTSPPYPPLPSHSPQPGEGGKKAGNQTVSAARPRMAPICDGNSALTLIGIDTTSGRMLFSIPPLGAGSPWLVELDAAGREARAYPDPPKGLFSGSVGPGPVIAAVACGPSCVQPLRWEEGSWSPVGEALTTPVASTLTPTYDPTGTPWLILHSPSGQEGYVKAWAYRLEGREWKSRGAAIETTAVGQPAALPAPQRKDGVLSGTGLFSASGPPQLWVTGVPTLPSARRGQLIALTGTSAAYLSGDGVVYLSDDGGKKWRRSTWTPWGSSEVVGSWRQGSDYWVDLPYGDHEGFLRLAWFDRRRPSEELIVLTRLTQKGDWVRLAEAPSEIRTRSGDVMPIAQILVPKGNTWVLLSGCAATADGSGLVVRIYDGANLSAPKFVPFGAGVAAVR